LKNALNLFRIALLDSIVITENGFTSMTNEGIFANGGSLSRFDYGGEFESPRIYIANLEALNDNIDEGEWLDFSDYKNADELMDAIQDLLNEFGVEEYIITDAEYLPTPMGMDVSDLRKANFVEIYTLMDVAKEKGISIDDAYKQMYGENDSFAEGGSLSRFDNGGLIRSLIPGTSGRSVVELPHSKYKIIKEVTNAQTNGKNNITYMNIVLPKGSIVNNLRGGVFVANEKLKKEYPTIYNEKYGLRITTKEETLKEIYKNSEILEYDNGGDLGMSISTKFKNYVSNHTISESFLYNNRMLSSREITPQQYELNRDYVLARRSERGFAEGGGVGIEEEIDLTDDNRLRVKELTYEYKKPTSKELAEKHNSGAYEFMEQDKMMFGGKARGRSKS